MVLSRMRTCLSAFLLALTFPATPARAEAAMPDDPVQLKALAQHYEREGMKREAAQAYERLLEKRPVARMAVAPRLVQLYVDTAQREKALAAARDYMDETPDPLAYLAGVYAQLGGYREAVTLLEKALTKTRSPRRECALLWQLADVYELDGRHAMARSCLTNALAITGEHPQAKAARRLVERFDERRREKEEAAEEPAEEVAP